jgi:hypothetical protein
MLDDFTEEVKRTQIEAVCCFSTLTFPTQSLDIPARSAFNDMLLPAFKAFSAARGRHYAQD